MTDIGDEVTTGFLYPPSSRLVVGQNEDQALVQWCHTSGEVCGGDSRASADLKVNHATLAFAPHPADELQQLGYRNPTASD